MEFFDPVFKLIQRFDSFITFTDNGYLEHFLVGLLIGGIVSAKVYKKIRKKVISFVTGCILAILVGLFKEFIDPFIGGDRDVGDFIYTVIGGLIGAFVLIFMRNLFATPIRCNQSKPPK
ncbi:MAG: hypothetical protein U5K51_02465 [Flavobacteriaceae bacterium]|nr:hypothetical protein [Flavobacteriaceae bacterium]